MDNGIKSKDRVKDFGEVFTPDKIVNDMLNLVDEQIKDLDYITTTFLEPACGDGQFLIRILCRKLLKVAELPVDQLYKKYGLTQEEIDYIEKTIKPME